MNQGANDGTVNEGVVRRWSGGMPWVLTVGFSVVLVTVLMAAERPSAEDEEQAGVPAAEASSPSGAPDESAAHGGEGFVELAPYMGELGRLTHKLSLSVAHENGELAKFYLYESLESLREMQEEVPEYRGLPIALLIDRLAKPAYDTLTEAIGDGDGEAMRTRAPEAMAKLIESCNQCHVATQHGFLRITDGSDVNPFNQDFRPLEKR